MSKPYLEVRSALEYLEPSFDPLLHFAARSLSGAYLRNALGIRKIVVTGMDVLLERYSLFIGRKLRLVLAFRHSHVNDGPLLFHLVSNMLPRYARRNGIRLRNPVNVDFVYARNVPLWSGAATAWIFPRLGGIPVLKGAADSRSLSTLRKYFLDGRFPIALAPEAQVSYHNGIPGPLDPGVVRLAFWCAEDLEKAGREEDVVILPIANRYSYVDADGKKLEALLSSVARTCGAHRPATGTVQERIAGVFEVLLSHAERYYARFHGVRFPEGPAASGERIRRIVDAALSTAETALRLPHSGTTLQRVLEIRTKGLSRIFRDDIPDLRSLSPLERGLADRVAAEAYFALRHMELADLMEYFPAGYFEPDSPAGHAYEAVVDLADLASRLRGGDISGRPDVFPKNVEIRIGRPLPVPVRAGREGVSRKEAVGSLLAELGREFIRLSE